MGADGWPPAYNANGQIRGGAWVADVTGLLNLEKWRHGCGRSCAQNANTPARSYADADRMRITAFATNTAGGQLPDLELRHRWRARCEDRIRVAKDTGLRNLALHDFTQNQIGCAIVAFAVELTAYMQPLTLTDDLASHDARRCEPKCLRLRLLSIADRLAEHARGRRLHQTRDQRRTTDTAMIINSQVRDPGEGAFVRNL